MQDLYDYMQSIASTEKDQLLFFLFLLLFANTPSDSSCFVNWSEKKFPKHVTYMRYGSFQDNPSLYRGLL